MKAPPSVFLVLLLTGAVAGAAPDDLTERFLTEAPKKWREYNDLATKIQGKSTVTSTLEGDVIQQVTGEWKRGEDCNLAITTGYSKNPGEDKENRIGEVTCYNSRYAFRLSRKSEAAPWVLVHAERRADDNAIFAEMNRYSGHGLTRLRKISLDELLKRPSFRLVNVSPFSDASGRHGLVRVEFTNHHPVEEKPFCPEQEGVMVLDSDHFWCLHSGKVVCAYRNMDASGKRFEARQVVTFQYETEISAEGVPMVRRTVEDSEPDSGTSSKRSRMVSVSDQRLVDELPPESEFTLTAFGLPEVFDDVEQPVQWYLWAMLVGIGCVVAMGAYAWWRKHAAR